MLKFFFRIITKTNEFLEASGFNLCFKFSAELK